MKYVLLAAVIAVMSLVLAACGGSASQPATSSPSKPSAVAAASSPPAAKTSTAVSASNVASASAAQQAGSFDQQFIDMMVPHHQGAIEMAQIAMQRAEHPEIKTLAGFIINAQNKEIGDLKSWRQAWFGSNQTPSMDQLMRAYPNVPGMSSMMDMDKDTQRLRIANPFDLAFIDAMIPHHQGAVDMAQVALGRAQHQEIKVLAQSIINDQQAEIAQLQGWRKAWHPSASPAGAGGMPAMSDMPGMAH